MCVGINRAKQKERVPRILVARIGEIVQIAKDSGLEMSVESARAYLDAFVAQKEAETITGASEISSTGLCDNLATLTKST